MTLLTSPSDGEAVSQGSGFLLQMDGGSLPDGSVSNNLGPWWEGSAAISPPLHGNLEAFAPEA